MSTALPPDPTPEPGPGERTPQRAPRAPGVGRALAEYTALRVVVLAGAYGLLLLLGVRAFPAVVGALLVSALVSLVLFRRQRDAVAVALAARSEQRRDERQRTRRLLDDDAPEGRGPTAG